MTWQTGFKKGKEITLVTSSKAGKPNANIVISLGLIDDKLLIADCQMKTTTKNIKNNKQVCIVGGYFKLKGTAKIYSSGKYFDLCIKNNPDYKVKSAILIKIKQIIDLDNVCLIK